MTNKANTSRHRSLTHGCCDSQVFNDKAAPAVAAKPEAAPSSAAKGWCIEAQGRLLLA